MSGVFARMNSIYLDTDTYGKLLYVFKIRIPPTSQVIVNLCMHDKSLQYNTNPHRILLLLIKQMMLYIILLLTALQYAYKKEWITTDDILPILNRCIEFITPSSNSNSNTINRRSTTGQVQQQTPPGYNKQKRDTARLILCFVTGFILLGQYTIACCFSAASILCLKEGELLSTKNKKWMMLSIVSFVVSLILFNIEKGSDIIDGDKAYTLKILLWITAKSIVVGVSF